MCCRDMTTPTLCHSAHTNTILMYFDMLHMTCSTIIETGNILLLIHGINNVFLSLSLSLWYMCRGHLWEECVLVQYDTCIVQAMTK